MDGLSDRGSIPLSSMKNLDGSQGFFDSGAYLGKERRLHKKNRIDAKSISFL